jgi:hypothetical protein
MGYCSKTARNFPSQSLTGVGRRRFVFVGIFGLTSRNGFLDKRLYIGVGMKPNGCFDCLSQFGRAHLQVGYGRAAVSLPVLRTAFL